MYWPLNTPKVYTAYNTIGKADNSNAKGSAQGPASDNDALPRDSTIIGLEVGRNGHLFATITTITLTIWQLSVGTRGCLLARSD